MFNQVESFRHVHEATVHVATVPDEVVDSLNDSPSAHVGGDTRLVGELKIINPKLGSKEICIKTRWNQFTVEARLKGREQISALSARA